MDLEIKKIEELKQSYININAIVQKIYSIRSKKYFDYYSYDDLRKGGHNFISVYLMNVHQFDTRHKIKYMTVLDEIENVIPKEKSICIVVNGDKSLEHIKVIENVISEMFKSIKTLSVSRTHMSINKNDYDKIEKSKQTLQNSYLNDEIGIKLNNVVVFFKKQYDDEYIKYHSIKQKIKRLFFKFIPTSIQSVIKYLF